MQTLIKIHLHTQDIMYDVALETYLWGESHKDPATTQSEDTDEESGKAKILGGIGSAYANITGALSQYMNDDVREYDDSPWTEDKDLTLQLLMPGNFNTSVTDTMTDAAHGYAVNYTCGSWYDAHDADRAETYYRKASAEMEKLREMCNRRLKPSRGDMMPVELLSAWAAVVPADFGATEAEIKRLPMIVKSARAHDMTVESMEHEKLCYAYPAKLGALTSITDASGFEYISSYERHVTDIGGSDYYCYVLRNAVSAVRQTEQHYR